MARIKKELTELIGGTPLLELSRLSRKHDAKAQVVAKLEYFNPGGSVKDRIALAMIEDAETKGILKPGAVIIEPTSGNTGVGLAWVASVKGYKAILTMPETMSKERQNLLKAMGAQLVLTEGAKGMKGAIEKAEELREQTPGAVILGQFENPANPAAHVNVEPLLQLTAVNRQFGAAAGVVDAERFGGVGDVQGIRAAAKLDADVLYIAQSDTVIARPQSYGSLFGLGKVKHVVAVAQVDGGVRHFGNGHAVISRAAFDREAGRGLADLKHVVAGAQVNVRAFDGLQLQCIIAAPHINGGKLRLAVSVFRLSRRNGEGVRSVAQFDRGGFKAAQCSVQ